MAGWSRRLWRTSLLLDLAACNRGTDGIRVHVLLPEAQGLALEAPLAYRGVTIGRVEQIALQTAGVAVTIRLIRTDIPLHVGDSIGLVQAALIGGPELTLLSNPGSAVNTARDVTLVPQHATPGAPAASPLVGAIRSLDSTLRRGKDSVPSAGAKAKPAVNSRAHR